MLIQPDQQIFLDLVLVKIATNLLEVLKTLSLDQTVLSNLVSEKTC